MQSVNDKRKIVTVGPYNHEKSSIKVLVLLTSPQKIITKWELMLKLLVVLQIVFSKHFSFGTRRNGLIKLH